MGEVYGHDERVSSCTDAYGKRIPRLRGRMPKRAKATAGRLARRSRIRRVEPTDRRLYVDVPRRAACLGIGRNVQSPLTSNIAIWGTAPLSGGLDAENWSSHIFCRSQPFAATISQPPGIVQRIGGLDERSDIRQPSIRKSRIGPRSRNCMSWGRLRLSRRMASAPARCDL